MWHDLWSQCYGGGCVPSRSVPPLQCCGRGETALVWVHRCAGAPLCGSCRERASRGWPKTRWALRHSAQLSSSASKAIKGDLRNVRVDAVRCPSEPTAVLPLLMLVHFLSVHFISMLFFAMSFIGVDYCARSDHMSVKEHV